MIAVEIITQERMYYGEVDIGGRPHGMGIQLIHQELVQGWFDHGRLNGRARYIWDDDQYYEGDTVNNYREGRGVSVSTVLDECEYAGQFVQNKFEGFGTIKSLRD